MTAADPVYATVAEFAAELVRRGVTEVVLSPGSRSTPLALGLDAQRGLRTWVHLDERSAGFFALGLGRASGRPAVLVCTSGTAAANYAPAIVEAHHAGVPLIACTADRPPELRGWGAGQTIDQVNLYGDATRWAADLPVAGEVDTRHARIAAMRAVTIATGSDPGPIHLNWPFREPLEPRAAVPTVDVGTIPAPDRAAPAASPPPLMTELVERERGIVVAGPWCGRGLRSEQELADAIDRFAAAVGWPVIGEPLTHARRGGDAVVVTAADRLLAEPDFAAAMAPEVVVRIGRSPTTKPVRLWLERHGPEHVVLIDPAHHWNEASFTLTEHLAVDPRTALAVDPSSRPGGSWIARWHEAETVARAAIDEMVDGGPFLSAAVARTVVGSVPAGSPLMVSNSMPVRLLDTYAGRPVGPVVIGNRGASGIDGITSTALGVAASTAAHSVALLTGDLALLHDLGGLIAAGRLDLHLTVVCIDNGGGGIFAMLPVFDRVPGPDHERLFHTPHGLDLTGLDRFGGVRARAAASAVELAGMIDRSMAAREPGVDLIVVAVDRDSDIAQQRQVSAAVTGVVAGLGW